MKDIIYSPISISELEDKIAKAVENKLTQFLPQSSNSSLTDEYITRKEVCDKLHITLPTLHKYSKSNTLKSYRIGNRVLYKLSEVETALTEVYAIKHKKSSLK